MFTFQVYVFSCSFQKNRFPFFAKWQAVGNEYAFNVTLVKLLRSCSRRLQLHKVNASNDVYKNMWSCCRKWDGNYSKIRESTISAKQHKQSL